MNKYLFIFFILTALPTYAQKTRAEKLDSAYNDPFFFPTVSAIILPKGFVEVNNFASLFSTNQLFTNEARRTNLNLRLSQFTNQLQFTCGASATSRFNIGADLLYTKLRLDANPDASGWGVFGPASTALDTQEAFTQVGLRVRWKPVARNRSLLLQGGLYLPIYKPGESQTQLQLQVIRVYELGRKLFLYAQPGLVYSLPKQQLRGSLAIPITALVQYQLQTRLGLVGLVNHTAGLTKNADGVFAQTSWNTQVGAGLQYQPSLQVGFSAFMTQYILGKNSGIFQTVNLGIRVII
ncbi:hypothetical protein ACAW74_12910 [Fibrella sp. WM1]|uniref:hypothetical protein n=1 Tax=Fibrella musci TaxID=3242485 RepID=UPI0035211682